MRYKTINSLLLKLCESEERGNSTAPEHCFSCKNNPSGTIHIRVEPTFLSNLAPDRSFFKTEASILCLLKSYDIGHILSKLRLHMVPVIHDVNVDVIFNVPTAEKVQTKIRGVKELTDTDFFEVFVTKVQSYYVDGW